MISGKFSFRLFLILAISSTNVAFGASPTDSSQEQRGKLLQNVGDAAAPAGMIGFVANVPYIALSSANRLQALKIGDLERVAKYSKKIKRGIGLYLPLSIATVAAGRVAQNKGEALVKDADASPGISNNSRKDAIAIGTEQNSPTTTTEARSLGN